MGGGIVDHLVEVGPGAPLLDPALLGQRPCSLEPLDQLIAYLLQLGEVGDVALGPQQRMARLDRSAHLGRIGGELALEPADLPAKLLPRWPLLALLEVG